MRGRKQRIVVIGRANFADALPIPAFDYNWSEYPACDDVYIVPRLYWATRVTTHACSLDANTIGRLEALVA